MREPITPSGTIFRKNPLKKNRAFGRPSATSTNMSIVEVWLDT